jgi:hypothetical protein
MIPHREIYSLHSAWRVRRMPVLLPLLVALVWGSLALPVSRADDWQPKRTWVVVVGVLEWQSKAFTPFPQKDRRDAELVDFFRSSGMPAAQTIFLKDRQATRANITNVLAKVLTQTRKGDLLFLYYAGHGTKGKDNAVFFANYDADPKHPGSAWSVASIFDTIERYFKGSHVLLAADCCHSGALGLEAKKRKSAIAYACLTSVTASGLSTNNWTFTECLLRGFRGDALLDLNGDGSIQLEELARFTEAEMIFAEGQMSSFTTMNGFGSLKLAATKKRVLPKMQRRVEVEWRGSWYKAFVEAEKGNFYRIHYAGYDSSWDEWVGKDRIRVFAPKQVPAGSKVEVEWSGKWYPARILEVKHGMHLVHYDGYEASWDEWVPIRRIRQKK